MPLDPCNIAPHRDADLLLVGGGLANGLIAWRLKQMRPHVRVLVLEAEGQLGGNHTWSFHSDDLSKSQQEWMRPLVSHSWPGHEVRFPQGRRRMTGEYASVTSSRFDAVVSLALDNRVRLESAVAEVAPDHVRLADGRTLTARAVVDGRGVRPSANLTLGFQKFLGQEVRLRSPHGLEWPILMDATVVQQDASAQGGFRFMYVLPLSPDTVLIENTVYADGGDMDDESSRQLIAEYASAQGWSVEELVREERGVLPIVLSGDVDRFWDEAGATPRAGLAAGLFHPTTGYSLPDAVALADLFVSLDDYSAPCVHAAIRRHATSRWHERRFFRLLNRMLFRAAAPGLRWKVMQRFYQLPEPLIGRFYASRLGLLDKLRIVTGRPPVPIMAALNAAFNRPSTFSTKAL